MKKSDCLSYSYISRIPSTTGEQSTVGVQWLDVIHILAMLSSFSNVSNKIKKYY